MNPEKPQVKERYSRSVISSNLRDSEHHHATDVLAAVALSSELGTLLFRVKYANDKESYPQLRAEWIKKVTHKADYRHWPTVINPKTIAIMTLDYWLNDVCEHCNGLGYEKHENAPTLTDKACKYCEGTGTKPFTCQRSWLKYANDVLDELHQLSETAGANAVKKLRKQCDF